MVHHKVVEVVDVVDRHAPVQGEDGIDPSRGVHGSPFNIDIVVDDALGTDGAMEADHDSYDRDEQEDDLGGWEFEAEENDGGEN